MQQSAIHSPLHTCGHQRAHVGKLLPPGIRSKFSRQQLRVKAQLLPIGDTQQRGHPTHRNPTPLPPTEGWKATILSSSRVLLLAGAVAAAMLMEKRPAVASMGPPQVLADAKSRTSSSAAPRGVWHSLKSATGAPFQALDRLLFPDESIAFVRTSTDGSRILRASAQRPAPAEAATPSLDDPGNTAPGAVEATDPMPTSSTAAFPRSSADAASSSAPQLDIPSPARLAAVATALGTKLTAAIAHSAASLPAPSWPAESCALAGLSQVVSHGAGGAVPAASPAAMAKQLRVWGYSVSCLVLAIVAWQLAASASGNKIRKPGATCASTTSASAAAVPSPVSEVSGMLTDPDGSSCTAASLAAAKLSPAVFTSSNPAVPQVLAGKQVVGPYCLMQEEGVHASAAVQNDAHLVFTVSDPRPASLLGKRVVGPYCLSHTTSAAAAAQGTAQGQDQLPVELQGKEVVGPYCLVKQQPPEAEAARAATAKALGAQLAALHQAARETAVDDELSCMMTAEAAASSAAAVVETTVAAAAAAQRDEAADASQDAMDEHTAPHDDHPVFRVDMPVSAAPVGATASMEGTLAAEAVREALVAESAAAAAAVAAERARAAAHLIELTASSHSTPTAALAAHTAAEATMAAAAAAEVAAAVLADKQRHGVGGATESMVAQLAAEAKAAEAAAAMAEIRRAVLGSQGVEATATVTQDDATTDSADSSTDYMQVLIAEAVGAEAAAEELSGASAAEAAPVVAPVAQTPAAAAAEMQSLIAEATAAEAAAMSAKLAKAELIAEAIAAEAAAAAGRAAAQAAGAAAFAGGSAGDAAEAVRPPRVLAPAETTKPGSTSSTKELQQGAVVSWVLDMGAAEEEQLSALTALAATNGHPAIVRDPSGTTLELAPTSPAAAPAGTEVDSTDADAFKDEFPEGATDNQVPTVAGAAAGGVGEPALAAVAAVESSCSHGLAAALDAASQQQMQQASATAVQLAQARLAKLYQARRMARAPQQPAASGSSAVKSSSPTSSEKVQQVAEAYSYLGVSDTALALALASLDAAGPVTADKAHQADTVQEAATAEETAPGVASADTRHSSSSSDTEAVLPPSAEAAKPAASGVIKVEAAVESGSFTVPVLVLSSARSSSSSSNPYAMVAEALGGQSGSSATTASSAETDSFEVEVLIERDTERNEYSNDAKGAAAAAGATLKGFGRPVQRAPGRRVRPLHIVAKQPRANLTSSSSSSSAATARISSIPIEWISTPNSSKRVELKQHAAAVLSAEQQQEPHQPAADEKTDTAARSTALKSISSSSVEFSSVTAQLADVEPEVAELVASAVARLDQRTSSMVDADMAAAYGMPKPLLDSNSSSSLPPGWSNAIGRKSDSGSTAASSSSWSAVSAQLAAELETDLADLVASAAARLDKDMEAAYSTPQVRLPAGTEPATTGSNHTEPTSVATDQATQDGTTASTDDNSKTGAGMV